MSCLFSCPFLILLQATLTAFSVLLITVHACTYRIFFHVLQLVNFMFDIFPFLFLFCFILFTQSIQYIHDNPQVIYLSVLIPSLEFSLITHSIMTVISVIKCQNCHVCFLVLFSYYYRHHFLNFQLYSVFINPLSKYTYKYFFQVLQLHTYFTYVYTHSKKYRYTR